MDSILIPGIWIILWLQKIAGWLTGPMQIFSTLGTEQFYLLIAPAVFWCLNPSTGLRLGVGLMLSGAANSFMKLVFHAPRPYWIDPDVQAFGSESSFGLPSGHAQNAVVFWGLLARGIQQRWAWLAAIFLMVMIGLSRLSLGVHFPSDIAAGWLIGILLLWIIFRFEKPFLSWFLRFQPIFQIVIVLGISLGLILAGILVRLALGDWQIPPGWIELANRAPGAEPISPLELSRFVTPASTLFGLASGAILLKARGWLDVSGPLRQRLLRYLLGVVGVVLLWAGLDKIFPTGETWLPSIFRFIRYAAVGFWITYLAPLLFFRLKLAHTEE